MLKGNFMKECGGEDFWNARSIKVLDSGTILWWRHWWVCPIEDLCSRSELIFINLVWCWWWCCWMMNVNSPFLWSWLVEIEGAVEFGNLKNKSLFYFREKDSSHVNAATKWSWNLLWRYQHINIGRNTFIY